MLQFRQSDTSAEIVLTLTEKVSINDPYYLFVFIHVLTRNTVKFIKSEASDESNFERYNKWTINPSVVFDDQPAGEWHYTIYEQASSTNTDTSLTGDVLEKGKLMLVREADFEFEKYTTPTTYKAYNG